MKPLIIVSHFDDEVLGCSSLFKYNPLVVVVCGDDERIKLTKNQLLSNINYYILDYKPLELQHTTQSELVDKISKFNDNKFDCIFTHSEFDNHSDHKIVSNACDVVFRSNRTDFKLYCKFMVEPVNIANFKDNFAIEVNTDYKNSLLEIYKNYIPNQHLNLIKSFNAYTGAKYNLSGYAEPFEIVYQKEKLL